MITKRFGKTEVQMPLITMGGMRFQESWQDIPEKEITKKCQDNLEQILGYALDHGINHIETARGYGTSEVQLAKLLPNYDREKIILQSKVAPTEDPRDFTKTFETTMSNLKVDYLDLFSIHGINNLERLDWALQKGGALDQALQWQKEGRIKHIGFSSHASATEVDTMINTGAFSYVNLHYYYVNQSTLKCLESAKKHDMGVLVISPNDKGGHLWKHPEEMAKLTAPLHPMQFNALFCFLHEQVGTLTMGVARPSDFDIHLETLKFYEKRFELIPPMIEKLNQKIESKLGQGWMEKWFKGIPDWSAVPHDINIWETVRLYTFATGLGLDSFAKARYNMLGKGGHYFPGLKALEVPTKEILELCGANPFKEKIPEILKRAHQILDDSEIAKNAGPKSGT
ncbi:MAG: aldo/keto reductase [SAR324 cluster bacterium]|nr:aldo/keto reductase [SAR324 cluster bacterium]